MNIKMNSYFFRICNFFLTVQKSVNKTYTFHEKAMSTLLQFQIELEFLTTVIKIGIVFSPRMRLNFASMNCPASHHELAN